jgi:voltage-gated potassium channel Kch
VFFYLPNNLPNISGFIFYALSLIYEGLGVISAFWWAMATLTTVGYGDVYPVTGIGKLISGVISVLGIGIVALATGIISAGFISRVENQRKEISKLRSENEE